MSQVGEAVIVGRGAGFIIPAERRYNVRLVATVDKRIRRICEIENVDEKKARTIVQADDNQRQAFVSMNFNRDVKDPLNYDIVINTSEFTTDKVADLIIAGFKVRYRD